MKKTVLNLVGGPVKKGTDFERMHWAGRMIFIVGTVGTTVGFGNFWRFPKQTYKNGGGVFFLPYLIAVFFFGIPLLILELGLG